AGVTAEKLAVELVAGELHLLRVDDDDEVTGVEVRCERRLVLAADDRRDARGEATEHLTVRVEDEPLASDLVRLRRVGLRVHAQLLTPVGKHRSVHGHATGVWRGHSKPS